MDEPVVPKLRLDAVVKLRERDEQSARQSLADAQRRAIAAAEALRAAERRAREDERKSGHAALWQLADSAHVRVLAERRQAEDAARAANDQLGNSREKFMGAHARAEAVRRVVEVRRAELAKEAAGAEQRVLDELAVLRHGRR